MLPVPFCLLLWKLSVAIARMVSPESEQLQVTAFESVQRRASAVASRVQAQPECCWRNESQRRIPPGKRSWRILILLHILSRTLIIWFMATMFCKKVSGRGPMSPKGHAAVRCWLGWEDAAKIFVNSSLAKGLDVSDYFLFLRGNLLTLLILLQPIRSTMITPSTPQTTQNILRRKTANRQGSGSNKMKI